VCGVSIVPPIRQQPVGSGALEGWRGGAWPTIDRKGVAGDEVDIWDGELGSNIITARNLSSLMHSAEEWATAAHSPCWLS